MTDLDADGHPELLVAAYGRIHAYDVDTGRLLWSSAALGANLVIGTGELKDGGAPEVVVSADTAGALVASPYLLVCVINAGAVDGATMRACGWRRSQALLLHVERPEGSGPSAEADAKEIHMNMRYKVELGIQKCQISPRFGAFSYIFYF